MSEMRSFVLHYLDSKPELSVVDIGSCNVAGPNFEHYTYKSLFTRPGWKYTGIDLVLGLNVDTVIKDEHHWLEIPDNSYDVVVSGQAIEHVRYPWVWIREVYRVLKTGGLCCIIGPSAGWIHRYPIDCWRIHPDGMQALADWAGLKVLEAYDNTQLPWIDSVLIGRKE
jgi:SAM-dependent methyltransferase